MPQLWFFAPDVRFYCSLIQIDLGTIADKYKEKYKKELFKDIKEVFGDIYYDACDAMKMILGD